MKLSRVILPASIMVTACGGGHPVVPMDGAALDVTSDVGGDRSNDVADVRSDVSRTDTALSDASCVAPRVSCGTECVDLARDSANCGSCGHGCSISETCSGGSCVATADAGSDTATSMSDASACSDATPTTGVQVPASIDSTGATDASAALNMFVASVPDGSTIVFNGCGNYRLDQGLQFSNRHHLTFDGNGATLTVGPAADGHSQLTSPFVVGHTYGGFWAGGNSYITIRNFTLVGNSPTPGVFVPGTEGQSGIEIADSSNIDVSNVTVRGVWSDGIKIGGTSDTVSFHDSHVISAGRNGVTITMGQNVTAENNRFDVSGYCVLDIESNYATEHSAHITFRNNTAGTWGVFFLAADGIAGSSVSDVTISGNTITGGTLQSDVTLARRQNITFINNTSSVTAAGPVLRFSHVDGLTITGNVQPLSSGMLASLTDCTGVTYVP